MSKMIYVNRRTYLFESDDDDLESTHGNTLHTATACFSKKFMARYFNHLVDGDVPLRKDGSKCGEDDFSMSRWGDIYLFNVADGVGSWTQYNVNPKIFAKELLKSIDLEFKLVDSQHHDKELNVFLKKIVTHAYRKLQKTKKFIELGSSTLVTLSLNLKTLHLNSYVLGDSGFMIVRNRKIFYRSLDLLHGFNWPYQLAFRDEHSDSPLSGFVKSFQLMPNDVILIGSDGLFDNLYDEAILYYINEETSHLSRNIQKGYTEAARRIAKRLTIDAKRLGEDTGNIVSPFSEEVNRRKFLNFTLYAGKNDDTTVVVFIIS